MHAETLISHKLAQCHNEEMWWGAGSDWGRAGREVCSRGTTRQRLPITSFRPHMPLLLMFHLLDEKI